MNTTTIDQGTGRTTKPNGRRPQAGERERVLAEWARNGKSVEEMAAASGWSTFTLYRWRNEAARSRLPKPAKAAGLIAVPRPPDRNAGSWAAEVAAGAVTVRLAAGCPVGWIGQLVRELRSC